MTVLTPTKNTRAEDFDTLERFWSQLGSVVVQMSAADHDRALAVTSHLPHLVASALAAIVPECYFRLAGTGILDTDPHCLRRPRFVEADIHSEPGKRNRGVGGLRETIGRSARRDPAGGRGRLGTPLGRSQKEPRCFGKLISIRGPDRPTCRHGVWRPKPPIWAFQPS